MNEKIIGEEAKVSNSNDQAKSNSSDLVEVQFKWEERTEQVSIEVCFLGFLRGHIL